MLFCRQANQSEGGGAQYVGVFCNRKGRWGDLKQVLSLGDVADVPMESDIYSVLTATVVEGLVLKNAAGNVLLWGTRDSNIFFFDCTR